MTKPSLLAALYLSLAREPNEIRKHREVAEDINRTCKKENGEPYSAHASNVCAALSGDPKHEYLLAPIASVVLGGEWECEKKKEWHQL